VQQNMAQLFHHRKLGRRKDSCGKDVEIEARSTRSREMGYPESLSKRTQRQAGSGANATIRAISKTKAGYKFFLYRGMEIGLPTRSGTPLASLTVEATFVASLAYRSVPAHLLPPEIHSPELSLKPLCSLRIQRCLAAGLCTSLAFDFWPIEFCELWQRRTYCGEAL